MGLDVEGRVVVEKGDEDVCIMDGCLDGGKRVVRNTGLYLVLFKPFSGLNQLEN